MVTDEVPNLAACWVLPAGLASLEQSWGGEGEDHKGSTGSCRAGMRSFPWRRGQERFYKGLTFAIGVVGSRILSGALGR